MSYGRMLFGLETKRTSITRLKLGRAFPLHADAH